MPQLETQGARIRRRRIACRYTQEYLAAQLHTTKQAIYKYEADIVRNIPADKFARLAFLLGCSVEWLSGSSEDPGVPPEMPFAPAAARACNPAMSDAVLSGDAQDATFAFVQQLMAAAGALSPAARQEVLDFAAFLQARETGQVL